jgi:hypothetical protein
MYVERLIVYFKPGRAPPPSQDAHRAFSGDQANEWKRISDQFDGLALNSNVINGTHNHFYIDVPPGADTIAILKALREWPAVEDAYLHLDY